MPEVRVIPNYPCDDEGLPTSTAGGIGDKGDIECFEKSNSILVEVTMAEGRIQTTMEVWPITRHLEAFQNKYTSKCTSVNGQFCEMEAVAPRKRQGGTVNAISFF